MVVGDELEIETHPAPRDVQFLEDRIYEFNAEATGIRNGELLGIFLRGARGAIEAGLYGWTWGDCCRIDKLWVRGELRRSGLGRRLVQAAEREALRRGCRQVTLDTHSFQAPGFYRKLDYELWATLEGYPGAHQQLHLRKRIGA